MRVYIHNINIVTHMLSGWVCFAQMQKEVVKKNDFNLTCLINKQFILM